MMPLIPSPDTLWVLEQGYGGDYHATIGVLTAILALLGIGEGRPLLLWVSDNAPEQVEFLSRPARKTVGHYKFEAVPDPADPLRFPQPRQVRQRLIPEAERDEDVDGPYRMIDVRYGLVQTKALLREDGTLVIPL